MIVDTCPNINHEDKTTTKNKNKTVTCKFMDRQIIGHT